MTHLVQVLLPLCDNDGRPFPHALYTQVKAELTERYGGLTAYTRSPAEGIWREEESSPTTHDEVIVMEVMCDVLDRPWWAAYRLQLTQRFQQRELVVRALPFEPL